MSDPVTIRRATAADLPAVLALARAALGWTDADAAFLEWKHLRNAYGESPMWVAEADGRTVGFRTFLCWELVDGDGRVRRAVRAVDTATDPAFQGRGIFTRLTLQAVDELRADGVELVFNTPNTKSLPGYLKMGWTEVGRLPLVVRPTHWRFPLVVATARRPASRAPVPTNAGEPATAGLADAAALDDLIATLPHPTGLGTHRTAASLAWRYGNPDLGYRVLRPGHLDDGLAVFRLRRRGSAVEAVVCEVLAPDGSPARQRELVTAVAHTPGADYLIRLAGDRVTSGGFVRLPRMGPVLTCRPLDASPVPTEPEWALTMGDVELL